MREIVSIAKALSDESRLRALMALRGRELCLCQIVEILALASSTVSKHMSVLRQADLVEGEKRGRWMYYRLPAEDAPGAVRLAVEWACGALSKDGRTKEDAVRLREVLKLDPEDLCRLVNSRCCRPSPGRKRK